MVLRDSVVLNPHYASMGLRGSEYWTYVLPRRVGELTARSLTDDCLPIGAAEAVRIGLADMALRVDASRLLTWRAAHLLDAGRTATKEAAMAKLHASETAMFCTWAAVQTLGGMGYSREYPVEKWMRDAKLEEIEEGTSDIQRLIISRRLLES